AGAHDSGNCIIAAFERFFLHGGNLSLAITKLRQIPQILFFDSQMNAARTIVIHRICGVSEPANDKASGFSGCRLYEKGQSSGTSHQRNSGLMTVCGTKLSHQPADRKTHSSTSSHARLAPSRDSIP